MLARVPERSVSKDKVIWWKRKIRKRRAGCHLSAKISLVVLIQPLAFAREESVFCHPEACPVVLLAKVDSPVEAG